MTWDREPHEPPVPDELYHEERDPVCECGHPLDEHDEDGYCHVPGCGCLSFDAMPE